LCAALNQEFIQGYEVQNGTKLALNRGNVVQNRTKNVLDPRCELFFETKNSSFPGAGT